MKFIRSYLFSQLSMSICIPNHKLFNTNFPVFIQLRVSWFLHQLSRIKETKKCNKKAVNKQTSIKIEKFVLKKFVIWNISSVTCLEQNIFGANQR